MASEPSKALEFRSKTKTKFFLLHTTNTSLRSQLNFLRSDVFRIWAAAPGDKLNDELVDAELDQGPLFGSNTRDRIVIKQDYGPVAVTMTETPAYYEVTTASVKVRINRIPATFECYDIKNMAKPLWKEVHPIDIDARESSQQIWSFEDEQFYGGGQQNGKIAFKGSVMRIGYSGGWEENDRPSPAPFYFSSAGYGVLRNTWRDGQYDFSPVDSYTTSHQEKRFDAYYFAGGFKNVIDRYTELTGRPHVTPR